MALDTRIETLTEKEQLSIQQQVNSDLVDHLYEASFSGVVGGFLASWAMFFNLYGHSTKVVLYSWIASFDFLLLLFTILCILFKTNRERFTLKQWQAYFFILLCGCSILWGICTYIAPADISRQYVAITFVFGNVAAYAIATIGYLAMCVTSLVLMSAPVIIWCMIKGGFLYYFVGIYLFLFLFCMLGLNSRSTIWLKDSLRLKIENTLSTHLANHDMLTDLPNQRALEKHVESAISIAEKNNTKFSIISLSLNRIELIKESLGYDAIDNIILSVSNRLNDLSHHYQKSSSTFQFITTLSRQDTFTLLLNPIDAKQVAKIADAINTKLSLPFKFGTHPIHLTASMGICIYPSDGQTVKTLLSKVDGALLQAKKYGGNRIEYAQVESNTVSTKIVELENMLYKALSNGELEVYYQPVVSLLTGKITSAEALIRWNHKTLGKVAPMNFIPIAEEVGLIVPIGEWVLNESCREQSKWHVLGYSDVKVSVNVSAKQIYRPDFSTIISRALQKYGTNPALLELEITEGVMLDEQTEARMATLNTLGIRLAIDDFGTGYAGLSYLKRFKVNRLKIDKSFIDDIATNKDTNAIVSATIAMAKELDIMTVAEGVETQTQLRILRQKKCDFVQGFYFSKAIPAVEFLALLKSKKQLTQDDWGE